LGGKTTLVAEDEATPPNQVPLSLAAKVNVPILVVVAKAVVALAIDTVVAVVEEVEKSTDPKSNVEVAFGDLIAQGVVVALSILTTFAARGKLFILTSG
jgi:hypothetical protein